MVEAKLEGYTVSVDHPNFNEDTVIDSYEIAKYGNGTTKLVMRFAYKPKLKSKPKPEPEPKLPW